MGSDRFRIFSAQGSPRQIRCQEPFTDLNPFPTTGDPCPAPVPLFLRGGASSKTRRTLQSGRDRRRAPGLVRRLLLAALGACFEGLRIDPDDDAELHFRKAVLHRKAGQPAEAEACWRRILTLKRPDQFCSVDQGIYGHLTLRNLAVLVEERGDRAEARRLWRMVRDACPGDAEAMASGEA